MTAPVDEQCLQAIATRLGLIRKINGYRSDLGLRVIRWRRSIDESDLPCLAISDGSRSISYKYGDCDLEIPVLIEAKMKTTDVDTDAPDLAVDLYQSLTGWDFSSTPIVKLTLESIEPKIPETGSSMLSVEMRFRLTTRAKAGDLTTTP